MLELLAVLLAALCGGAVFAASKPPPHTLSDGTKVILTFLGTCALALAGVFGLALLAFQIPALSIEVMGGWAVVIILGGLGALIILFTVGGLFGFACRWTIAALGSRR